MGPPGSGKGTQAEFLARYFGYEHYSTGHLLRSMIKDLKATPEERQEAEKIQHGRMVDDWLIFRLVFAAIEHDLKNKKGIVLDGAIRTLAQAKGFAQFFTNHKLWPQVRAVWIDLPEQETINRSVRRRICLDCNFPLPYSKANEKLKKCPKCNGWLVRRSDDKLSVVKKRLKAQGYKAQKPVLDFFKKRRILVQVDGAPVIKKVSQAILGELKK